MLLLGGAEGVMQIGPPLHTCGVARLLGAPCLRCCCCSPGWGSAAAWGNSCCSSSELGLRCLFRGSAGTLNWPELLLEPELLVLLLVGSPAGVPKAGGKHI
jgi:hypothetical protein